MLNSAAIMKMIIFQDDTPCENFAKFHQQTTLQRNLLSVKLDSELTIFKRR